MQEQDTRMLGTTGAGLTGLLMLLATAASAVLMWRALNGPFTISTALIGDDARALMSLLFDVLYDAVARIAQHLEKGSMLIP
jgi:hypothetical protein